MVHTQHRECVKYQLLNPEIISRVTPKILAAAFRPLTSTERRVIMLRWTTGEDMSGVLNERPSGTLRSAVRATGMRRKNVLKVEREARAKLKTSIEGVLR